MLFSIFNKELRFRSWRKLDAWIIIISSMKRSSFNQKIIHIHTSLTDILKAKNWILVQACNNISKTKMHPYLWGRCGNLRDCEGGSCRWGRGCRQLTAWAQVAATQWPGRQAEYGLLHRVCTVCSCSSSKLWIVIGPTKLWLRRMKVTSKTGIFWINGRANTLCCKGWWALSKPSFS